MGPLDEMPPTLSVTSAGEFLGMSPSAAYRAVERGELPTIRLAGRLRVPTPKLLRLLGYEPSLPGAKGVVALSRTADTPPAV
jgi:hypothetical protein